MVHFVSIHAPRAGRDLPLKAVRSRRTRFQSTRPVRGATPQPMPTLPCVLFQSTRPVRGATRSCRRSHPQRHRFNPRAPCGARHIKKVGGYKYAEFQSTRPVRGATNAVLSTANSLLFQSTRPVRGATANEVTPSLFCHIFMGITRHKYDFLGILSHAPPPAWFAHLYFYTVFSVHFTFALRKNAQMMMADSKS